MSKSPFPQPSDLTDAPQMACGAVVDVRTLKSLGVTRIVIEIPAEFHVEATRLLYGHDAVVVPMQLPPGTTYGICRGGATGSPSTRTAQAPQRPSEQATATKPAEAHSKSPFMGLVRNQSAASAATRQGHAHTPNGLNRQAMHDRTGEPRRPYTVDMVAWMGARCNDPTFKEWLGVGVHASNEDTAARVREICGVSSRAELKEDGPARRIAVEKIMNPYLVWLNNRIHDDDPPPF